MPNTDYPTATSSIISPSPNLLSRSRSFSMSNFTKITEYLFHVLPHHHYCASLHSSLNDTYFEQFDDAVAASFFTDVNQTTVATDVITSTRNAIIASIEATSQADHNTIAPMVNSLVLFAQIRSPIHQFSFRSPSTIQLGLIAVLSTNTTQVVIQLNTAPFLLIVQRSIP